ncbi:hydrogenase maturation protease [Nitrosomonas marina]|uniref:Hydrogenase maturation protease n=1 Tax=Nitrosomonas marina TaxID=917 RepID=A0A1H8ARW9_9PROT|nr:hydrogenase maturation protease [Nitrosomonas marina]SEM72559.1 hydrogenase maturation protease [Nitrosomonas marina]
MKRLLIFGYGNPGRGDDVLGLLCVEKTVLADNENVNCRSDMQLQVEHVTDLQGQNEIIFVDADVSCAEPFEFSTICAQKDDSYTSHALTPAALLYVYQLVYRRDPPAAFLLRIRGYNFALGDRLSEKAAKNLELAIRFMDRRYKHSWMLFD